MAELTKRQTAKIVVLKDPDGTKHIIHLGAAAERVVFADGTTLQAKVDGQALTGVGRPYGPAGGEVFNCYQEPDVTDYNRAAGANSHAEGSGTQATGDSAHAEGISAVAGGLGSHAEGHETRAGNFAAHAGGKYNKAMTEGGAEGNVTGDALVVGNGTGAAARANALRVTYAGEVYALAAFNASGADYAEYFEWLDGNPEGEDRVGLFVTLEGDKLRLAQPGEYVLGIVSANPCIIGNADEDWLGRWLHDPFGRFLREYLEEAEAAPPEDVEDAAAWARENGLTEREGKYYALRVADHETGSWRYAVNPSYDPSRAYAERKDRPEWAAVGMMGVLAVRDDGTCRADGYCQVHVDGIATAAQEYIPGKTWRVIQRVSKTVVKVIFR